MDPSECMSSGNVEVTLNCANKKMDYDSESEITTLGVDVASSVFSGCDNLDETTKSHQNDVGDTNVTMDAGSESCTPTKKCVIETTMSPVVPSSPVCRNLSVVLNRIEGEDLKKKSALNMNIDENIWDYVVGDNSLYSERRNFVKERHDSSAETSEIQEKNCKENWRKLGKRHANRHG